MPVRGYNNPSDDRFDLPRTIHAGDLIQLNLLDTRQFRDSQYLCSNNDSPYGFGNYRERCPVIFDEQRSMLGKAQERSLMESIASNKSTWNVIASTSVFSPFYLDIGNKTLNFTGSWDGYPANRDRVVNAIKAE